MDKSQPTVTSQQEPLYTTSLALRFQAHKPYFNNGDSTVHLRCTSRVSDLSPQHADVYPHLSLQLTNEKLAQEILSSGGTVIFILAYRAVRGQDISQ